MQSIVGTVLEKGLGGGESLFSGSNMEGGGAAAAAAAAAAKLPGGLGGTIEVMEWAEFLGWGWGVALRAGDALLMLQEQGVTREVHARNEVFGSVDGNFAAGTHVAWSGGRGDARVWEAEDDVQQQQQQPARMALRLLVIV